MARVAAGPQGFLCSLEHIVEEHGAETVAVYTNRMHIPEDHLSQADSILDSKALLTCSELGICPSCLECSLPTHGLCRLNLLGPGAAVDK